jgi:uncharacterized protein (TIGR04255 family)
VVHHDIARTRGVYATTVHGDDLPQDRMPLTEAVFEFKWKLTPNATAGMPPIDPAYKLLVGSLYDRVRQSDYPFHETLPAASVPDEFVPQIVQHRFRRGENGYPLIQVGPGILAVNETRGYSWTTFLPRVLDAVSKLRDTYTGELAPETVSLRYINAVPFDYGTADVFAFMRDNLKVSVDYPHQLFTESPVEQRPNTVILEASHSLTEPLGTLVLKFSTGEVNDARHLIWETVVQSTGTHAPPVEGLEGWLNSAHTSLRAWFFTLIEGNLEDGFRR